MIHSQPRPPVSRSQPLVIKARVVTYRLGAKLVYVIPADNYEKAVDCAYKVFGKEIADVSRDRIAFVVCAIVAGEHRTVRISPQAWPAVIPTLAKFEIIDVCITPEIQVSDAPPAYPRLATVEEVPEPVDLKPSPNLPSDVPSYHLAPMRLPEEDSARRRARSESPVRSEQVSKLSTLGRWMKFHT